MQVFGHGRRFARAASAAIRAEAAEGPRTTILPLEKKYMKKIDDAVRKSPSRTGAA